MIGSFLIFPSTPVDDRFNSASPSRFVIVLSLARSPSHSLCPAGYLECGNDRCVDGAGL